MTDRLTDNEVLDIVNEDDEVIGQTTRKEVHQKGYIHRSIFFFLLDQQGRVLVNQRTANKEFYPEYWSMVFGGHVQSGETYEDAVLREVKEEAGIEGEPVFLASFKKRIDRKDKENGKIYKIITGKEPILDRDELKQGKFLTIEELENKLRKEKFLPETMELLRVLKKNGTRN